MAMANTNTVCSMCGDVGFADKLFQCVRCHSRFQHSYCTNYYDEASSATAGVCDWCLSEERSGAKRGFHSKKLTARVDASETSHRLHYAGGDHKAEQSMDREASRSRGRNSSTAAGSAPSKPPGRRYKLLKDVLC